MIPTKLPTKMGKTLYICNRGCEYVTDAFELICPGCSTVMSKEVYFSKQTAKTTVGEKEVQFGMKEVRIEPIDIYLYIVSCFLIFL